MDLQPIIDATRWLCIASSCGFAAFLIAATCAALANASRITRRLE